jgi:site-specific DNA-methyltransferase (adenine-specific)
MVEQGARRVSLHAHLGRLQSRLGALHASPPHPKARCPDALVLAAGAAHPPGALVLDPYMGSGPVAQACKELGYRYIGVELVEAYCQRAVNRLSQEVLDL